LRSLSGEEENHEDDDETDPDLNATIMRFIQDQGGKNRKRKYSDELEDEDEYGQPVRRRGAEENDDDTSMADDNEDYDQALVPSNGISVGNDSDSDSDSDSNSYSEAEQPAAPFMPRSVSASSNKRHKTK
jgi:hypothetical protein